MGPSGKYMKNHSWKLPDDSKSWWPENSNNDLSLKAKPLEENRQ